ncbi:MAG: segregation/condensation protein A [Chloroflexota bacterium]|nr:segregation/condensation protein A [Chloroflexota bacterium]
MTAVAPYEVKLPAFEGPLDLLLQLVERQSLPITEVSLAQVTDSYLRRIEQLEVPAEEMSHFLVVASRLLLIKSRHLLPRHHEEETGAVPEELTEQLRVYQQFRRVAGQLKLLEGRTCYTQLTPPPPPDLGSSTVTLPSAILGRALHRTLQRRETAPPVGPPVNRVRLRLADVVARAERILQREGSVTLHHLAGPDAGRMELVIAFLAVLDLVRRRRARAVQATLFGPVTVYPAESEA